MHKFVIIINYGDTSSNNISKILHQLNISHIKCDPDIMPSYTQLSKLTHIILSGGPRHVYDEEDQLPLWVIEMNIPVLAICYGMQLVAHHFGGKVVRHIKEKGIVHVIEIIGNKVVDTPRWMNKYDKVLSIPEQFTITGISESNEISSFTDYKKWFCYQYHPEVELIDLTIFTSFLMIMNN